VSRSTAVSNVIRIGDAACEREEVAFAQGIGTLTGWNGASSWSRSSSPIVGAAYNHERTQEVVNGDEVHREA
jgi:hypothetical protein